MIKILIYRLIANYRLWRKYPRGAIKQYQEIVGLKPNSYKHRFRLAELLYIDHEYSESLKVLNKLNIEDKLEASVLKVKNYIKLEMYSEADLDIRSLKERNDLNYDASRIIGNFYMSRDDMKSASIWYEKALKKSQTQNQRVNSLHTLGYIEEELKDNVKADLHYRELLGVTQNKNVLDLGVGYLHEKRGWLESAKAAYNKQLKIDNLNANLHFRLGFVYRKLKDEDRAVESFSNFVKHDSKTSHELDNKLIVFDAFMGKKYADSPKEMFEYMLKDKEYADYKFVWILGGSVRKFWWMMINPRIKLVPYGSKEYFRVYAKAKYWVTNSRLQLLKKSHPDQVYIQCWHGTPLKRLGFDVVRRGIEGSKYTGEQISKQYADEAKKLDYFISPSRYASECFTSAFALDKYEKKSAIVEEGYPRNDPLINHTDKQIANLRKKYDIPSGKKVLLYAPTWRDDSREGGRYVYRSVTDFDYLRKNLSDEWVILFRPHYFIANAFNFSKYKGFIYDASEVEDVNELYIISDVLMTDYSSVFFDYSNLKRPMIFYMYDLEHYAKDLRGFYIDLKELPGDIVKKEDEIIGILNNLDGYSNKHQKLYDAFNSKFNYLDDGNVAKRVVKKTIR